MKNNRSLFPPLFGEIPTGGGGGGSGNKIQLAELPEASLEYKDKIVQYIGLTTETLTNGYFYKCVEHTTTEGGTITVTYSWDNIDVMNVSSGGKVAIATVTADGNTDYATLFNTLANAIKDTISTDKTYIMTYQRTELYDSSCYFYKCVEINDHSIVFESQQISVSSGGSGSLTNTHYILDFEGNSKNFNGTSNGSTYKPNKNEVFTVYEV